jgi:hypothetical protein
MDTLRLTSWPLRRLGIVMELGLADVREYVMTYAAYGPAGPRIATAVSRDLVHWQRRGLVRFGIAILIVVLGCLFTRPARNALRWGASARLAR